MIPATLPSRKGKGLETMKRPVVAMGEEMSRQSTEDVGGGENTLMRYCDSGFVSLYICPKP